MKPSTSIWSPTVLIATAIMLLSGTMNTISFKFQNGQKFTHGLVQTCLMFIGEFINIVFFAIPLVLFE